MKDSGWIKTGFFLIFSIVLLSVEAFAAKPEDFLCLNDPPIIGGASAQSASFIIKSCGPGQTKTDENMCLVKSFCIYLTQDLKDRMARDGRKKYEDLTYQEKFSITTALGVRGAPTDLICRPTGEMNGMVICPPPELCKGDLVQMALKPAVFDPRVMAEMMQQRMLQQYNMSPPKVFHPEHENDSNAGAGK